MLRLKLILAVWVIPLIAMMAASATEGSTLPTADPNASTHASWPTTCSALLNPDFVGPTDAPLQITSAVAKEATSGVPAYCETTGYISPQVGFKLGLPAFNWNGKFLELGCGGDCGYLGELREQCAGPLDRGYACLVFDAGHTGGGGLWAVDNLQGHIDFGYRGAHVAAVAGKAIVEHYYGTPAKHAYFMGGSTGGRQALIEAERFPWDFDGIASGAPWINDTDSAMNMVWAHRALRGEDGKPLLHRAELQRVHDAVIARCDMDDGVKDGIIGNPAACKFDPAELLCKAAQTGGCLAAAQVEAVKKVYDGPRNSKGERTYISGAALGSEMGWVDEGVLDYIRSDGSPGGSESWALEYFRYMTLPPAGPSWKMTDFDFDRDYQRINNGVQESLLNAANPDLRKFKAAGGKLIIYQGWNDQSDLPQMTIDYYETLTRTMGGRPATEAFARLFVVPGMLHVSGGEGAFAIDYLAYLEAWVEENKPPEQLTGAHIDDAYLTRIEAPFAGNWGTVQPDYVARFFAALTLKFPLDPSIPVTFTRPVYPYPLTAKYTGKGDSADARNFKSTGH